jgi:hypothetical protein
MSQENVEIGLGAFDVAGLPCRQVEERLLALVELDSGRQSVGGIASIRSVSGAVTRTAQTSVQLQIETLAADRNGNSVALRAGFGINRLICAEARHSTGLPHVHGRLSRRTVRRRCTH